MKHIKKIKSVLIFAVLLYSSTAAYTQTFNIKDFGAKGDGKTDDSKAFQRCAQELVKKGGTLIIPYGTYYVSSTIHINYIEGNDLVIRGEKSNQGKLPQIRCDKMIDIFFINGYYTSPKGKVLIENIGVLGNNPAYSSRHPFYGKEVFQTAFRVVDKISVYIHHCEINNVYGNGFYLGASDTQGTPLNRRMQYAEVTDNKIYNTWGARPKQGNGVYDNYGDGIYFTNISKGLIGKNQITNNLSQTKQYGRSGIVLEYDVENVVVEQNEISGYDRNIHIELAIGNNIIRNNKLTGSDYGICIWNACKKGLRPSQITGNYISNEGIPKGIPLKILRDPSERSLIYIGHDGSCKEPMLISNNQLVITNQSGMLSKRGLYIPADVEVQHNQYKTNGLSIFSRPQNRIGSRVSAFR